MERKVKERLYDLQETTTSTKMTLWFFSVSHFSLFSIIDEFQKSTQIHGEQFFQTMKRQRNILITANHEWITVGFTKHGTF